MSSWDGKALGIDVAARPHDGDEDLGPHGNLASLRVVNGHGIAGEVDEEALAGLVLLAHHDVEVLLPGPVAARELAVGEAVGVRLFVLVPQELERHVLTGLQLPVHLRPVGERPLYLRSRSRGEKALLQGVVVHVSWQWP
jgi:hypothetical protein